MPATIEEIIPRGGSSVELFRYEAPQGAETLGSIVVLLDATTLPEALRYLGPLIAGAFRRTYFGTNTENPQRAFIEALRGVNDALAEEARQGTGQWVGMLYGLIAASDGKTLLLASSGGCSAYLARGGQTMEIPMEAGEGTRPFGSFTAGALHIGDTLLLGSRSSLVAQQAEVLLANDPDQLIKRLKKSGAACLTLSVTPELAAVSTAPSLREKFAIIIDGLMRIKDTLMSLFRSLKSRIVIPKLRLPSLPQRKKKAIKAQPTEVQSAPKVPEAVADTTSLKEEARKQPRGFTLPKVSIKLPTRPVAVTAGFILMLALALGITLRMPDTEPDAALASALTAARSALERGETKIILGEEAEAIEAFNTGLSALEGIDGAGMLRRELTERRNALSGIRAASTTARLSFDGFPVGIDAEHMALTGSSEATAIALGGASHPATWLNAKLTSTEGTFLVLPIDFRTGPNGIDVALDGTGFAVATTEGVALVSVASRSLVRQFIPEEGSPPYRMLASGAESIFVLTEANEVRLVTFGDEEITEGPWDNYQDERLAGARDMLSINNEPYVLLSNNTFIQVKRRARSVLYSIEGFAWSGTAAAFDVFGDGRLVILDTQNGRVLLTEQDGDIVEQYEVPGATEGKDIAIGPDGKSVFVLTTQGVVEVHLPPPLTETTE